MGAFRLANNFRYLRMKHDDILDARPNRSPVALRGMKLSLLDGINCNRGEYIRRIRRAARSFNGRFNYPVFVDDYKKYDLYFPRHGALGEVPASRLERVLPMLFPPLL